MRGEEKEEQRQEDRRPSPAEHRCARTAFSFFLLFLSFCFVLFFVLFLFVRLRSLEVNWRLCITRGSQGNSVAGLQPI